MKVKGLNGKAYFWKPKPIDWDAPSKSKLQKECKDAIALVWKGDIMAEEQPMPGTKQRFDFVNFSKKIIVEAQGGQHTKYNKFFHNKSIFNFADSIKRDEKKRVFAEMNGFKMIEIKTAIELKRILVEL